MREREKSTLLKTIGLRVRGLRTQSGLTIRDLAEGADLSLRFINQLEAGQGNISIAGLGRVAAALSRSLIELIPPTNGDHSLQAQVWHLIAQSNEEDLRDFQQWFAQRAGNVQQKFIALVGLRGAGKSTVGSKLAKRLKTDFVELDSRIEKAASMSLGEIFSIHGEDYYRRLELEALQKLFHESQGCVVATGGSIVTESESWNLVKRLCFTVWLQATPREHMARVLKQGDLRPMKDNPSAMSELKALLARREHLYAEANLKVRTSRKTPAEVVALVTKAISKSRTSR
jgi:XRE family transcriptional regulator, aerobic/anaerobic benzoate catabolism transcriptional regulator